MTPQAENPASPDVAAQQNSVSENGVPNSQIDDFRDTPAYLRQDPRVQGFADDSDVQRSLAEPEAQPTAQDLIQQQMESGEQGFTPDELSILQQADQIRAQRTPRLPAPGNIHPGEGFPMPGPIQSDESQAGSAPQFTAGEQTRGQVYLPREQAEQQGAVRETHTYDGQTDPQAITDKNIIFADGPVVNPDDAQSGKAPQFEGGQRKDVRRFTETMGGQPETAITDQRQRAGGVPIDARTEAYAKGEVLGELRLHAGKPFSSEKVARFTKWAKMPGAVIEPVGDGFGVRMPPEPTTANTKTAPSNEGVVASGEQLTGELKLHLGKPFNSEKVAKYSKWGKMPGATIEVVGKGYGVRLPVPEPAGQAKIRDAKIDDFGEELKGAAKHKWGQLAESLKADHDIEDIKKQPLSKLFPHPDYSKMHESGVESDKLALLAALRSIIPTKPSSPYKVNQWAEQVKGVRSIANSLMGGNISVADIKAHFQRSKTTLNAVADKVDLISQFKPEQMAEASKYSISSGHYTYFDGKSYPGGKTLYELVTPRGMKIDISAGSMSELLPKAKAFIETKINSDKGEVAPKQAQLAPKQAKLEIYTRRADKSVFIGYKGAMGVLPLKAGFKTPTEARAYLAENRAEIEAKLDKLRKISREEQRKLTNEPRIGIERRKGNVTPEQFSDAFGFRGVQFGNYVEGARRQSELNDAYDSLIDIAELLNVPPKALSLNGELGLAFGARGKGGAKAHYEPVQVVINLTKGNGAGSLAHEWFHALDNYFGTYDVHGDVSGKRSSEFITDRRRPRYEFSNGKRQEITHPVRQEVYDAFKSAVNKVTSSGMMARAALLDGGRSKAYWTTKLEMSARAFERYLLDKAQSKGITNDYLVNLRKADEHANPETYAYPTEAELNSGVRQAFDHLFQTIKTKPTDKGIAFYSRKGTDIGKGNVISDTGHTAATGVLEVIESLNKMDFERIGKDVVKVFMDGQEKLVQVNDPELYRAFTMIDLERSNSTFMKAARTAKKVLTVSTTSMPDFIIRNFMRDSIHSWAINKDGFKPVTASWAGFKKALRTDDSLVDMMFAGATFGGGYSNVYDPASTAKTIRSVLRRKGYNDSQIQEFESSIVRSSKEVMGKVEQGLHKYKNLSEAAENANRLATYEAAIKSGKSKAQAAFDDQTSLLMREIGEATNMSPKMLDHIVMGYTGSLGSYVMGATNLLMRNLKDYGETPAMRLDELPVIKSFFRGSDPAKSTQFTEDFYRMMTEANQINSTINSFRKQGRGDDANELIEENRGKLSQRQGLTATQKQVKALNAQIEMMRRDRILTADQKREKIDRLMATRNKLVQQAVERVNPYFNK